MAEMKRMETSDLLAFTAKYIFRGKGVNLPAIDAR